MNPYKIVKEYLYSGSDRSQLVKRNAAGSLFIKLFAMAIDFAKVPVLLTFLDSNHYGVYITIASIVAWTHQFDFGLGSGLRYKLTEAISVNNTERGKQLVSTAYLSMSAIMALLLLISIPIFCFLNWAEILNCEFIGLPELTICISLVLAVFVVQFVLELISIVLQADQRAAISNIFKPLANLLTIVTILFLNLYAHNSLFLACIAMTVPIVVVLLFANVYYFTKKYKSIAPCFKDFRTDRLKDIYSLGLKYFTSELSSLIVFSTASFLLSHYINPLESAVYNTAWTYFGVIVMFNAMVLTPIVAAVTDAYVKGEEIWIRNAYNKITIYCLLLSLASLLMLAVSQIAFKLWVGEKIIVPWNLSIILTVFFICNIWSTPYRNFLGGVGKMNISVIMSVVKILVFFPIAIFFIKTMSSVGLVFAMLIVNTLPNLILGIFQYHLIITHKAKGIWNK